MDAHEPAAFAELSGVDDDVSDVGGDVEGVDFPGDTVRGTIRNGAKKDRG